MKYFISCNHPYKVNTPNGPILVSCNHCTQCQNAKRAKTTLLLDLEAQSHKYVEFLTLTYSDDFVPYVNLQDIEQYIEYYNNLSYGHLYEMSFPVHLGDRYIRKFNPKTKSYMLVKDTKSSDRRVMLHQLNLSNSYDSLKIIKDYDKRVQQYKSRYPYRHFGESMQPHCVRILWYDDIRYFIDRLRQHIKKHYAAKIRYYIVCEYGTNGLRPHYHILLFHDSPELRHAFESTQTLKCSTSRNVRECASFILKHSLWTFGDCTTVTTDGHMQSYVASYVNCSTVLPAVLRFFPQKAFKSIFLGESRSYKQLSALLKSKDFRGLTTTTIKSAKGLVRDVSVPSSSYDRFSLRFSLSSSANYVAMFELLRSTRHALEKVRETDGKPLDIYDDEKVYKFFTSVTSEAVNSDSIYAFRSDPLCKAFINYVCSVVSPKYHVANTINSLKSLLYATRKLYKVSNLLDIHPLDYCYLLSELRSYLTYQRLLRNYQLLELDANYAYQYYSSFGPDGTFDFDILKYKPLFISQVNQANIDFWSDIKHKEVSDTYNI